MKDAKTLIEDKISASRQQLQNAEETIIALHSAIDTLEKQTVEMKAVITALEDLWEQLDLQEEIAEELRHQDHSSPSHQSSTSEPSIEQSMHKTN